METKRLNITVESKIYNAKDNILLKEYCAFYSFLHRTLFNILRHDENIDINKLRRDFLIKYDMQSRLFNSIHIRVKAELSSLKELNKEHIRNMKHKIKSLESKNTRKSNKNKHTRTMKLNKLKDRLEKLQDQDVLNICFGGKLFYKKQFSQNADHEKWLNQWRIRRDNNISIIGSSDETNGNSLAQLIDLKTMRLTLPNCIVQKHNLKSKHLSLDINFDHDGKKIYDNLKEAIKSKKALTYRILQREDSQEWYIQASFGLDRVVDYVSNGNIGIDMNHDLIVASITDPKGNFIGFKQYPFKSEGKTSDQLTQILSTISNEIVDLSVKLNKNIIIEELDLANKRTENSGRITNRKLHMLMYTKFFNLLKNKALKESVLLKEVNPAFTSIIGAYKYMKPLGINRHTSASFVIARRGFPNIKNESIPHQVLDLLQSGVNSNLASWSMWSKINKSMSKSSPRGVSYKRIRLYEPTTDNKINPSPLIRYGAVS